MSRSSCPDCGEAMYSGRCTWCHEEVTIEEQYYYQDMPCPPSIQEKAKEQREKIREYRRLHPEPSKEEIPTAISSFTINDLHGLG